MTSRRILMVGVIAVALTSAPLRAQTQGEMNKQSCDHLQQLEQKLSELYAKVLKANKGDKVFISKLKKSQQAWFAFRDAQFAASYPHSPQRVEYGSVYPMCRCDELTALTQTRIEQLEEWAVGVDEGNVCVGSRAEKEPSK